MRVYNLIRDLTADAYGGWHLVVALQAGGGLSAQRVMMNRIYDMRREGDGAGGGGREDRIVVWLQYSPRQAHPSTSSG